MKLEEGHNNDIIGDLTKFMTDDGYTDLDKAIFKAVKHIRHLRNTIFNLIDHIEALEEK